MFDSTWVREQAQAAWIAVVCLGAVVGGVGFLVGLVVGAWVW